MFVKTTIGAAIAIFAVVAPAVGVPAGADAAPAAACSTTTGVTVIVDFTSFSGGNIERGCASGHPTNGLAAMHAAGFTTAGTAQYGDAFVCRIDGLPTPQKEACAATPSASAFWAYWHARPTDTKWTYAALGVLDYKPAAGTLEAFAFGNHAQPGIAPTDLHIPTSPTTTPSTAPATAPPSTRAPSTTQPAAGSPTTQPQSVGPPVGAATIPPATATTSAPAVAGTPTTAAASTTTTTSDSTPVSALDVASPTSSPPRVIDRAAAPNRSPSSGSPLPAILTIGVVGALGAGGFALARARRRRSARSVA